jgi:HAD superfamily hydrolase (TIGR01484 family)
MRPIAELDQVTARRLVGIFCDIDDTLTHGGHLVPAAYAALCAAAAAGLRVVPVTGRPCGWAEVLAALWPVAAVVGEGGAAAALGQGEWLWWDDATERALQTERLETLREAVATRLPWARLARDQGLRRVDLAYDIGEREHVPPERVEALLGLLRQHGAYTLQSSVHAHATFGDYDKARMAVRLARERWGEDEAEVRDHYLFVGDSPNDQAGFAFFTCSVGVANVARYLTRLAPPPRWVARQEGGHGFAEIVEHVLTLRQQRPG